MKKFDVVIVGAGAAGLFCAGVAAQLGVRVSVIDHSAKVAEKIRISGGGRCNFTNREVTHAHFLSQNPHFCRSALTRFTPQDFVALVQKHGIAFHEKHKGQLFCDHSAQGIIDMLMKECQGGPGGTPVTHWQPCTVEHIQYSDVAWRGGASDSCSEAVGGYTLQTSQGAVLCRSLVIATGGLSIPQIGATDWGYRVAQQFGLRVVPTRPGLVPLTFDGQAWQPYAHLAGLALPVALQTQGASAARKNRTVFLEDLLFTHRGLSGPGVLQISSYWQEGQAIRIHLAPEMDWPQVLQQAKSTARRLLVNELAQHLPSRLAQAWVEQDAVLQRPVNEVPDRALAQLAQRLSAWELIPTGTEGYKKAEVTLGGVDTRDLSSQTMESKQPGLYFIGEVVDVTGWLGGYNFQWAWASAYACAQALAAQ